MVALHIPAKKLEGRGRREKKGEGNWKEERGESSLSSRLGGEGGKTNSHRELSSYLQICIATKINPYNPKGEEEDLMSVNAHASLLLTHCHPFLSLSCRSEA